MANVLQESGDALLKEDGGFILLEGNVAAILQQIQPPAQVRSLTPKVQREIQPGRQTRTVWIN